MLIAKIPKVFYIYHSARLIISLEQVPNDTIAKVYPSRTPLVASRPILECCSFHRRVIIDA